MHCYLGYEFLLLHFTNFALFLSLILVPLSWYFMSFPLEILVGCDPQWEIHKGQRLWQEPMVAYLLLGARIAWLAWLILDIPPAEYIPAGPASWRWVSMTGETQRAEVGKRTQSRSARVIWLASSGVLLPLLLDPDLSARICCIEPTDVNLSRPPKPLHPPHPLTHLASRWPSPTTKPHNRNDFQ